MMVFDSADAIGFCFGVFNLLRLASYFPQIVAVVRDDGGAGDLAVLLGGLDRRKRHDGNLRMGARWRSDARLGQRIQRGVLPARISYRRL
jgi:hypothetical protein